MRYGPFCNALRNVLVDRGPLIVYRFWLSPIYTGHGRMGIPMQGPGAGLIGWDRFERLLVSQAADLCRRIFKTTMAKGLLISLIFIPTEGRISTCQQGYQIELISEVEFHFSSLSTLSSSFNLILVMVQDQT